MTFCLVGCSAERKNVISKTYHNTTARYNAYFYAKQQIQAIEETIEANNENNYGRILRIYPQLDSALASTYKENVNEIIKMAGIAIERHKNSKWVDDSWILAGRARYYDLDFENAIETYKYVNKHGEDKAAKHEALIRLIKTFTDYKEYTNALAVSDYLDKEDINRKNRKLLYLTRAYYYQSVDDLDNMVYNLVEAAPLLKKKEGKARIYFIIGQIYQKLGFEAEAYNYYKKCVASNPEYELEFHARLNMAQVTQLKDTDDLKSARKVFEKLLDDSKNEEFKDKIYYEWAQFEAKQNNLDKALEYYRQSNRYSKSNRQSGLAYYRQATIYYDSLKNYRLAQAYYDSTVTTLPRDEEVDFTLIDKRHEVLGDFVKYFNIIEVNDSLLTLASLDSATLLDTLKDQVEFQREKELELAESQKQKNRSPGNSMASSSFFMEENTGVASNWYFDNPSSIAIGQNEFIKAWGNRPLVDYWRISQRVQQSMEDINNASTQGEVTEDMDSSADPEEFNVDDEVQQLYSRLPIAKEAKNKLLAEIEDAYYHLGNIYSLSLMEKDNAAETFESLLTRFPTTEHEPEVLYQLYLIYKSKADDKYLIAEKKLIEDYPNSKYARLVLNPNYTEESNATAEYQKKIYREAYTMYDTGGYKPALKLLTEVQKETEQTYFTSHLKLLEIMIIGKTENISKYQYELSEFIKNNPDSELIDFATNLLKTSKDFQENKQRSKGIAYIPYFEQQHYFVIVYPVKNSVSSFTRALEEFNETFTTLDLKTSNLILNEEYSMILVTEFSGKEISMEYMESFFNSEELNNAMPNFNLVKFVISKDNFNIFYQTKGLNEYLSFFDKFY